jgi:two-component system OmpR family response regulator
MDTILIVDDEPAIREIFTAYLEMKGYKALTAMGGMECLDVLTLQQPDLILLDMMMEPMDGWETLLAIRSYPAYHAIPVIIITGKQPVPEEILQYGGLIEDFIVKPVEFHTFVASLPRIIKDNKYRARVTAQKREEGGDPAALEEYTRLLRLVRITHHLIRRFGDIPWAERISLPQQDERLFQLHTRIGFPIPLPEWAPDAPDDGVSALPDTRGKPELLSG